jgi:hypothetical protein
VVAELADGIDAILSPDNLPAQGLANHSRLLPEEALKLGQEHTCIAVRSFTDMAERAAGFAASTMIGDPFPRDSVSGTGDKSDAYLTGKSVGEGTELNLKKFRQLVRLSSDT